MKKVKSIHAGLIAAVLLASVSTSALGAHVYQWTAAERAAHLSHWAPYQGPIQYFFMCTIGQKCEGSKWR